MMLSSSGVRDGIKHNAACGPATTASYDARILDTVRVPGKAQWMFWNGQRNMKFIDRAATMRIAIIAFASVLMLAASTAPRG